MNRLLALLLCAAPHSAAAPLSNERCAAAVRAAVADVRHVYPVEPELVLAVIEAESGFDPRAVSEAGAVGLMQVMPENAPRVGLKTKDLWDPAKNVLAGTRLLAALLKFYQGNVVRALIAYNAGPQAPDAQVPDNGETPTYVLRVLTRYRQLGRSALKSGISAQMATPSRHDDTAGFTARKFSTSTPERKSP